MVSQCGSYWPRLDHWPLKSLSFSWRIWSLCSLASVLLRSLWAKCFWFLNATSSRGAAVLLTLTSDLPGEEKKGENFLTEINKVSHYFFHYFQWKRPNPTWTGPANKMHVQPQCNVRSLFLCVIKLSSPQLLKSINQPCCTEFLHYNQNPTYTYTCCNDSQTNQIFAFPNCFRKL